MCVCAVHTMRLYSIFFVAIAVIDYNELCLLYFLFARTLHIYLLLIAMQQIFDFHIRIVISGAIKPLSIK